MNITQFCLPADVPAKRYPGIRQPFRIGKWLYASDARICVRIPATIRAKPVGAVPKANLLFKNFRAAKCTEPWPGVEVVDLDRDDRGYPEIPLVVEIGNRKVSNGYWLIVWRLGDVLYNPAGDPGDAIQFTIGNLQGLLQPREAAGTD